MWIACRFSVRHLLVDWSCRVLAATAHGRGRASVPERSLHRKITTRRRQHLYNYYPTSAAPLRLSVLSSQENFEKHGLRALQLTADFDEKAILLENVDYLEDTLEVSLKLTLLLRCFTRLLVLDKAVSYWCDSSFCEFSRVAADY